MLHLDDDEPREIRTGPLPVEAVGVLLPDPVVAGELEPLAVVGLEVGVGRLLPEPGERVGKVTVVDDERIAGLGMLIEPLGQKHAGAQVHRASPETGEQLAPYPDVLDVLRVRRRWNGRDLLIQRDRDQLIR